MGVRTADFLPLACFVLSLGSAMLAFYVIVLIQQRERYRRAYEQLLEVHQNLLREHTQRLLDARRAAASKKKS